MLLDNVIPDDKHQRSWFKRCRAHVKKFVRRKEFLRLVIIVVLLVLLLTQLLFDQKDFPNDDNDADSPNPGFKEVRRKGQRETAEQKQAFIAETFKGGYYEDDYEKQKMLCTDSYLSGNRKKRKAFSERGKPDPKQIEPDRFEQFKSCRQVRNVDCGKIIKGDMLEMHKAKSWALPKNWIITPEDVIGHARSCRAIQAWLRFPTRALTKAELDFPLAFTFLIHTNFNQFIRLLQRVYWPQNAYCIHIDVKAANPFRQVVQEISDCLPNVFVSKKSFDVTWGNPPVLQAAYECLKQLHFMKHKWKYAQILTETDMVMRTNAEMVEIFKIYNGSNDVELLPTEPWRFRHPWFYRNGAWQPDGSRLMPGPPANVEVLKGSFAASLSRSFARFMFTNPVAKEIYEWTIQTAFCDETLWPTLNHNLHISPPGGYPARCLTWSIPKRKPYMSRFQLWEKEFDRCFGKWVRYSCLYGVEDAPTISRKPHLVAHKFQDNYQPAGLYCLAEYFCNRTFSFCPGFETYPPIDRTYYEQLPGVRYHHMKPKDDFVCET